MSATNRISLLIVLTASLSVPATLASSQLADAAHTAKNASLAASPRSLEAYPWLAFQKVEKEFAKARAQKPASDYTAVKNHRSLSATPRMVEEYPQLALQPTVVRTSPKTSDTPAMLQNQAIAASPRILEEFPALARPAATPVYEIAPLK
jgi:hypothetical protein